MGATKTTNPVHDVLIVGAGPVGLALALDLGQRGVRALVVERKPGTGTQIEAKASVLNERTMEYCRRLGLRDEVANAGYPQDLPGDTVYCTALHDRFIGRLEMPSYAERDLPPESSEMLQRCPQCWFDPVLARAVLRQGMAEIRYSTQLESFAQNEQTVNAKVKNVETGEEEEVAANYLVACDGPASTVRKSLGIAFEGKDLGHTLSAIVEADINTTKPPFGRSAERYMFINPGGTWGNFTTIDGRDLWRFSVVGMEGKVDKESFDVNALVRQAIGRDDVPFTVRRVLQWRRSQYVAASYGAGRVFLAGDAAHTMSPTGGHGLNTGLGDASDVAWMLQALLEGWGGPRLAEAYQTERRHIAVRNGLGSTKNFAVWKDDTGRDLVLEDGEAADAQRKAIGERMAATMRQEFQALGLALGYNYADSPLIVADGSSAPPDEPETYIPTARPGHRAPHAWLAPNRSTIDLFGRSFVLVCTSGALQAGDEALNAAAQKAGVPFETIVLNDAEVKRLYERRLVLVRPDGMVAWRGDELPADSAALMDRVRGF